MTTVMQSNKTVSKTKQNKTINCTVIIQTTMLYYVKKKYIQVILSCFVRPQTKPKACIEELVIIQNQAIKVIKVEQFDLGSTI